MKITEKDLRIGNYVTVDNPKYHPNLKDIPVMVTSISQTMRIAKWTYAVSLEHINQENNKHYINYAQFICFIKPIPLTAEWFGKKKV